MNLLQLKEFIEKLADGKMTTYSLSNPFSWRGSYDEVAFAIELRPSHKEELLAKIDMAYNDKFVGYKGGEYRYDDYTTVNFEEDISVYSDGKYAEELLSRFIDLDTRSTEQKLIEYIFL